MKKISIAKALKTKNVIARKLKTLADRLQKSNSFPKVNGPTYDVLKVQDEYNATLADMIRLKVAIDAANVGNAERLAQLSELKSLITVYQRMGTSSGMVRSGGYGNTESVEYVAIISEVDKDKLIEGLQTKLEDIQDAIDHFNATTQIEF